MNHLCYQVFETNKIISNQIFGAFCSTAWTKRLELAGKSQGYFGTGETFLFSLSSNFEKYEWVGKREGSTSVEHGQELFMAGNNKMIGIGSGDGTWGIWLDENLTRGQTEKCPTFENKPLAKGLQFTVAIIQVIAFC